MVYGIYKELDGMTAQPSIFTMGAVAYFKNPAKTVSALSLSLSTKPASMLVP
jgi:hypothetical protein